MRRAGNHRVCAIAKRYAHVRYVLLYTGPNLGGGLCRISTGAEVSNRLRCHKEQTGLLPHWGTTAAGPFWSLQKRVGKQPG